MEKIFPTLGGYVTSSQEYIGQQNKINPDGLFSEQIFGPMNSYCCSLQCRHYIDKKLYEGKICPKCGGICASNSLRYKTFGKIKLSFPIIKPQFKKEILNIIGNNNSILLNTKRIDYLSSTARYIAIKNDKSEIKVVSDLSYSNNNFTKIPLRITGLYSLYIVFTMLYKKFNVELLEPIFTNNYITKELSVIPPNLRIVIFDNSKKRIKSTPIHKLYTSILKYENDNKKSGMSNRIDQDEQDIIGKILSNLENNINDEIVENYIINNEYETSKYQYTVNNIYQYIITELSGKKGLIRNSILARNIDFCARTVIRIDPSLKAYEIKVSKCILKKLWILHFLHFLVEIKNYDHDYCYDKISINENAFPNEFDEFLIWMTTDDIYKETRQ